MKKEEIAFLNQLIRTLGEVEPLLEKSFEEKNHESFDKSKRFFLQIQEKILEVTDRK